MVLCLLPIVQSIGVAPAYKEVFFEPGKELDLSFRIINNDQKDMKIILYTKGELANNAEIPNKIEIKSHELEKTVDYKVIQPLKLNPGINILSVYIVESNIQEDNVDVVKTNLGIVHKLKIIVPYPGEYLQGMMFIEGNKPNKDIHFTLSLNNLGTERLDNIKGTIVISDSKDRGVAQIVTTTTSLDSKQKGKIVGNWIPKEKGRYTTQAIISYNDEVLLIEKEIEVGEILIKIKDIKVVRFKLGDISRMDLLLENTWNEDIEKVLAKTEIYDEHSNKISTYDSSPVDIGPNSEKEIPVYWETQEVEPGNYILNVILEYFGKKTEKSYEIAVDEDSMTFLDGTTGRVISGSEESDNKFNPIGVLVFIVITLGLIIIKMSKKPKQRQAPVKKSKVEKKIKINEKTKEYIRYNMEQGISIKALKKRLLEKGYNENYIDQAILEMEDEKISDNKK